MLAEDARQWQAWLARIYFNFRFVIYAKVCKSLGLFEKEYFGLSYQDKSGDWLWVNLRNPLSEQLPQGNHVVMEMRVKYFISPHKILQPVTRCVLGAA